MTIFTSVKVRADQILIITKVLKPTWAPPPTAMRIVLSSFESKDMSIIVAGGPFFFVDNAIDERGNRVGTCAFEDFEPGASKSEGTGTRLILPDFDKTESIFFPCANVAVTRRTSESTGQDAESLPFEELSGTSQIYTNRSPSAEEKNWPSGVDGFGSQTRAVTGDA